MIALGAWALAQEKITNGPVVESTTEHTAVIAWSTNTGGSSIVKYGTSPSSLNETAEAPYAAAGSTHRVTLRNLSPNTTYYFQVQSSTSKTAAGQAISQTGQFQTTAPGAAGAAAGDKVPLYRLGNQSTGDHMFTTQFSQVTSAEAQGWKDEGVAAYLMKTQVPGTEPFYQLVKGNDHFYTANPSERNLVLSRGFQDGGVAGYIATSQMPGTVPLYRMVSTRTPLHFYTTSQQEVNSAQSIGYRMEGIAGYVWQH
jgi:hypothetical protein